MPSMQIYLARNNVQAGPYTLEQVNTMLASQEVLLTDLAWHENMDSWKPLSEITNTEGFYDPNGDLTKLQDIFNQAINQTNQPTQDKNKPKVIVIDATKKGLKSDKDKDKERLTVDELYGRKPVQPKTESEGDTNDRNTDKKTKVIRVQVGYPLKIDDQLLASYFQRIIASLIDWLTVVMICLPIFMRVDMDKFNEISASSMSMAEKMAASQLLAEQIPSHIGILCNLLLIAFFIIQFFMLVRKGQSLGKLIMGIRILDYKSHKLASPTQVVLVRSIVTTFVYLTFPLLLVFDTIYMAINKNRRSLHDKLAGTYVAKATTDQLPESKDKDNTSEKK